MHYADHGLGDVPVVLVHDFPLSGSVWEPQFHDLADRYRLLAPDLAGCGESDPPADPEAHSVEAWADDVIALVTSLGLERVVLAGTGIGADVALAVTRRDRELVGGLLLAGLRARPVSPDEERIWNEQLRWLRSGGELDSLSDPLVEALAPDDSPYRSDVVKVGRWMAGHVSREGWIAGLSAQLRRPDPTGDLGKIDVRTLFLGCRRDPAVPLDEVTETATLVPGAGVVELDTGPLPNREEPALFARALDDVAARRASGKHAWPAAPAGTRTG